MYISFFKKIFFLCLFLLFCLPVFLYAEEKTNSFQPLSPVWPVSNEKMLSGNIQDTVEILIVILVIIAAVLAVVYFSIASIRYMGTDSVFTKSDSKGNMTRVILGLLIVLSSLLILKTINPKFGELRLFEKEIEEPLYSPLIDTTEHSPI
jgi:heme/copper-type cytochrome/quinol oxidase subunit 2